MKNFMLLHYGFENPTPEIMEAWGKWFKSLGDKMIDQGGYFMKGIEISKSGKKDLPMGMDSITGYTLIKAASIDEAQNIAEKNPFIASIRVYEIMTK